MNLPRIFFLGSTFDKYSPLLLLCIEFNFYPIVFLSISRNTSFFRYFLAEINFCGNEFRVYDTPNV